MQHIDSSMPNFTFISERRYLSRAKFPKFYL